MRVVLLQDVAKVGHKYEVKQVADGFGRNFLLSRKLAMLADPRNLAKLEAMKKEAAATIELSQVEFKKALKRLAEGPVKIGAKASETGHLFASIHADDIAKVAGVHTDNIVLDHPIKSVGEHEIKIKQGDLEGGFRLIVEKK